VISCQFDKHLIKSSAKEDNVSFLFDGISDARHLYRTIIGIADHEHEQKSKTTGKKYHFTINDTTNEIAQGSGFYFWVAAVSGLGKDD
jgi:hypothetical protein